MYSYLNINIVLITTTSANHGFNNDHYCNAFRMNHNSIDSETSVQIIYNDPAFGIY
jgi:hypothetical protein